MYSDFFSAEILDGIYKYEGRNVEKQYKGKR
jgi:hypothetical protein